MRNRIYLLELSLIISLFATWSSQSLLDLSIFFMLMTIIFQNGFKLRLISALSENKAPLGLFIGYFIIACLGYIFNARPGAQIENLKKFDWIFVYILIYMVVKELDGKFSSVQIEKFRYLYLVPALYGFTIFFNHRQDPITGRYENDKRIVGLLNSPTYHAHVGIIILSIFCILIWETKKVTIRNGLIASVTASSILLTRTRGALVALIVGFSAYVIAVLYKKGSLSRTKMIVLIFISLASALLPALLIGRSDSTSCRQELLQLHLEMVKKYPLLGIGYRDNLRNIGDFWNKNEPSICPETKDGGTQAHNQFLNVAATTGFLGLFFFLGFYFMYLYKALKLFLNYKLNRNDQLVIYCILAAMIIFTASSMFEVMFEFAKIRYLLIVCWAFTEFYFQKYNGFIERQVS